MKPHLCEWNYVMCVGSWIVEVSLNKEHTLGKRKKGRRLLVLIYEV